MTQELKPSKKIFFLSLVGITILTIFSYFFVRVFLVLTSPLYWYEIFLSFLLLFAEAFIITHTLGYLLNLFRVLKETSSFTTTIKKPCLTTFPPVAIAVASYKEPLEILRETLICFYNLTYPNKHLYFLDDTRYELPWDTEENKLKYRESINQLCKLYEVNLFRAKWHGAKAGMINDFTQFLSGEIRSDFEYTHYSKYKSPEPEKYLIIFDADMNPFPDFVEYIVDIMEKQPDVAFVQTPQYYTNFGFNRVARAAGLQQAIFYEYICEGKNLQGAMFCCGTNVIFRLKALKSIGGFDESSVTEDFATSLNFHKEGWKSVYLNKVSAFGLGPEDLGGFFKQQYRWARGTLGVFTKLPKAFILNFRQYTIGQWWEYFLASTHYFIGTVFFIMVLFPILYIVFNIPSYMADPEIYLGAFVPYITMSILVFILSLKKRKYPTKDILSVLLMNAVSFPVFMKAAFTALLGLKTPFGITPKEGGKALSLISLAPQVILAMLCSFTIVWGILRIYYERDPFFGIFFNVFWTVYNLLMISSVLYFNHAEE
jgi:cellulose synthase (UDP-forming)